MGWPPTRVVFLRPVRRAVVEAALGLSDDAVAGSTWGYDRDVRRDLGPLGIRAVRERP